MSRTLDMRAEMEKRRNLLQEHQDSMEDPYPNAEEHQDSMKDSMKLKLKVKVLDASVLPNRSMKAIMARIGHFKSVAGIKEDDFNMNKKFKELNWTELEETVIKAAVEKYGLNNRLIWDDKTVIGQLPNRNPRSVDDKVDSLKKKINKTKTKQDFSDLKVEIKKDFSDLKGDIKQDFTEVLDAKLGTFGKNQSEQLTAEIVIYFGDHLFSDLRGPSKAGWRTAAIIHELENEIQKQNEDTYRTEQLIHGAVPVRAVLHHRRISSTDSCPRCTSAPETIEHCLFQCTSSARIWQACGINIPHMATQGL
ncbi:hypothetical protein P8452_73029 [Trifolium repens]|nr:hypothetical protein P8452_73029 [Trifolium repens]